MKRLFVLVCSFILCQGLSVSASAAEVNSDVCMYTLSKEPLGVTTIEYKDQNGVIATVTAMVVAEGTVVSNTEGYEILGTCYYQTVSEGYWRNAKINSAPVSSEIVSSSALGCSDQISGNLFYFWTEVPIGVGITAPLDSGIYLTIGSFENVGVPVEPENTDISKAPSAPEKDPFVSGDSGIPEDVYIPEKPEVEVSTNPFTDVSENAYYYDAVLWALENKITTGVTATKFQPTATCTRGQVVTFLWRAKGCPEPKTEENPFTDINENSPFYKAVLWAYENNITTGTTVSTFNPNGTCSNAHVVTFLWRAEGMPAAWGFSSLAAANPRVYFTNAVAWADTVNLLDGTGEEFIPHAKSPRANIVTYLYRNLS